MIVALWSSGWFGKYNGQIPIASSCSAAISAACHRSSSDDEDAALMGLIWGVVGKEDGEISHACFSSGEVRPLETGRLYA